MTTITLAGKRYPLRRFRYRDRDAIEQAASKAAGRSRNVRDCVGDGMISEHALVVWGVLQTKDLTPDAVLDLFDEHQEQGGDVYDDIVKPAYYHIAESGVLGKVDLITLRRQLFDEEREGKAQAAPEPLRAIRAAE